MPHFDRSGSAHWEGSGKEGKGALSTQSGALAAIPYGFNTRFGDAKGTNPEELIAVAHAGCFSMALAFGLEKEGFKATALDCSAVITAEQVEGGFKITKSALTLKASVPGIAKDVFEKIVTGAKANCPVSKVLNAEITLDWALS